jgi:hypothetical protein
MSRRKGNEVRSRGVEYTIKLDSKTKEIHYRGWNIYTRDEEVSGQR